MSRKFLPATLVAIAIISTQAHAQTPMVMGYLPSYRTNIPFEKIRYDRFTHIIHSFIRPGMNGEAPGEGTLPSQQLTTLAHAKNVKVLLALGGGSGAEKFQAMVADSAKRQTFISGAMKMLQDNNYDGFVLDWEFPLKEDAPGVTTFVRELRDQLKAVNPAGQIGIAVPAKPGIVHGYNGPELLPLVDFIHIMTYDYHGPWNHAGHNSPLHSTATCPVDGEKVSFANSLALWQNTKGIPKEKLLVGIANYARGFKVKSWGEKPTEKASQDMLASRDIPALIQAGWTRNWDEAAKVPWLLSPDTTERISYDDELSVAEKAKWAKANALSGYFFWEISHDFNGEDHTLVAAARKEW